MIVYMRNRLHYMIFLCTMCVCCFCYAGNSLQIIIPSSRDFYDRRQFDAPAYACDASKYLIASIRLIEPLYYDTLSGQVTYKLTYSMVYAIHETDSLSYSLCIFRIVETIAKRRPVRIIRMRNLHPQVWGASFKALWNNAEPTDSVSTISVNPNRVPLRPVKPPAVIDSLLHFFSTAIDDSLDCRSTANLFDNLFADLPAFVSYTAAGTICIKDHFSKSATIVDEPTRMVETDSMKSAKTEIRLIRSYRSEPNDITLFVESIRYKIPASEFFDELTHNDLCSPSIDIVAERLHYEPRRK